MKNAAVVGIGQTKFGEHWDKSLKDMICEASLAAVADAGVEKQEIESIYIGNMSAGRFAGQEHLGALAADCIGVSVPATRYEAACASGSVAFRNAYNAVAAGQEKLVLVIGVEKMTDVAVPSAVLSLAAAGDQEWEASSGLTFAGAYALIARRHMHEFGTTKEQLAAVAVQNHSNAVGNPYAQFPVAVKMEDVLNANMIAEPLGLLDCSPITDGAAAVVIAEESIAKKLGNAPAWVLGSGQGADTLALHSRKSLTEMLATKQAAKKAFEQAGVQRKDMDVVEVHDCFTINEIIGLEDLGFCEKGKGGKFVEDGKIEKGGEVPTNTLGGLKACGHPVGATGVRQIIDITRQLRGKAYNQVNGARYGLNLNIGGSGATAVVNIFGSDVPDGG
ncbi:MAG: thiolase domain-containing protein [Candidatus Aenigmarchaeota archaeon]|nr:thiolase domain-containing protein [Candidatus Aenigmarchaeota archaeon]